MTFEVEGLDQLKILLKRAAIIPLEAVKEFALIAEETKNLARNMAPEEFGDLKDAIKMRSRDAMGRFSNPLNGASFEIYVDGNHRVSDENNKKNGIETVGEYAWYVHEYMGYGDTPGAPNNSKKGSYMPSQKSVDAGHMFGVEAGGKFLERAGEEARATIDKKIGIVALKHIEALDL